MHLHGKQKLICDISILVTGDNIGTSGSGGVEALMGKLMKKMWKLL